MDDVGIAVLYPELLGTYGDGGNARILTQRLIWRGIPASVVTVAMGDPVPRTCSIYTLGGGEDAPQALASAALITDGGLTAAVDAGAVVLAVCAGLQVIGTRFRAGDEVQAGVGLVDADSSRPLRTRAVGELVIDPDPELGLPGLMSGYENHASITTLGPGVMPLGRVMSGVGNGSRVDGYWAGKVVGTYLHGPVLARNPDMADLLLGWAVGDLPALNRPDVDADAAGLREERLASALGRRRARHHFGT